MYYIVQCAQFPWTDKKKTVNSRIVLIVLLDSEAWLEVANLSADIKLDQNLICIH